jgi:hypothetical protein
VGIVIALVVAVIGSLIATVIFTLIGLSWWMAPAAVGGMFAA